MVLAGITALGSAGAPVSWASPHESELARWLQAMPEGSAASQLELGVLFALASAGLEEAFFLGVVIGGLDATMGQEHASVAFQAAPLAAGVAQQESGGRPGQSLQHIG